LTGGPVASIPVTSMSKEKDTKELERYFDRRTVERHLKRGTISSKDWEKHLKSLPDASAKLGAARPPSED
jgi:hypothetical protein